MRMVRHSLPFLVVLFIFGTLAAQPTPVAATADQITQLQQQVADAKSSADNA